MQVVVYKSPAVCVQTGCKYLHGVNKVVHVDKFDFLPLFIHVTLQQCLGYWDKAVDNVFKQIADNENNKIYFLL